MNADFLVLAGFIAAACFDSLFSNNAPVEFSIITLIAVIKDKHKNKQNIN